ncbi:copper-binding protein [Methylophaga sp. 42_25_T18]|nr:copper-binding protein [Methylophaga sp. 42_25_T18]OUR86075.1 copper-binding protein [Methylophaga sp. 42_8_T64]
MKYGKSLIGAILAASAFFSTAIMAADHVVKAQVTAFKPIVVKVAVGDTVSWENMNGHITESVEGMIPEGAESWMSKMGDNFTTAPLTVEGVYFYKCTPHWGAGMGGVIIVGEPTNFAAIVESKPKGAAKRLMKKAKKALK